ncbi:MAG: class I SAM-dependent methyltransferase, partial [Gammaproteobacteria bacterium]
MAERLKVRKPSEYETIDDYLMYLRHQAAYQFVFNHYSAQKRVIDLGCGTGYGTEFLANTGEFVVGVDRAGYALPLENQKDNLGFCVSDVTNLPFANSSFDIAVSFQVIEHIEKVNFFLNEAHRILSKDGVLILSTPNKKLRLFPLESPWNPYHVKEYNAIELKSMLEKYFSYVQILGLQATREIEQAEKRRIREVRYGRIRQFIINNLHKLPLGEQWVIVGQRFKRIIRFATQFLVGGIVHKYESRISGSKQIPYYKTYTVEDYWVSDV